MNIITSHADMLNGAIYLNDEYLGSCIPFRYRQKDWYLAVTCAHVIFGDNFTKKIDDINNLIVKTNGYQFTVCEIISNEDIAKKSDVILLRITTNEVVPDNQFIELNVCSNIDENILSYEHALIISSKKDRIVSSVNLKAFNKHIDSYSYEAEVDKLIFFDINNGIYGAKAFKGVSGSGLFITKNNTIFLAGLLSQIPTSAISAPIRLQKVDLIIDSLPEFDENNALSLMSPPKDKPDANLKEVCFNNFTMKSNDFYLTRECDNIFNYNIKNGLNIWVHGISGTGKTAILMRNLMLSGTKYIYCDLEPVVINNARDIWQGVVDDISFKQDIDYDSDIKDVRALCQYLLKCELEANTVLIIDEMSCDDINIIDEFCNSAVKLVQYYTKQSNQKNIIFIVSSIFSPHKHKCNKGKFFESFEILCSNDWVGEIDKLFDIQNSALGDRICYNGKKIILENCHNLPRLLTKTMARIYRVKKFDIESIAVISKNITEEYKMYD